MGKKVDDVGKAATGETTIIQEGDIEIYEIEGKESPFDHEVILDADAAISLDEELGEIEDGGILEELAQAAIKEGYELLSEEETLELFERRDEHGKAAGDAIAEIYRRNQGLVKSIASRYRRKDSWLNYNDLVLEGNIGLLIAIQRYDTEKAKKAKFSTYAYETIRGRVLRAQANDRDPRVIKPFSKLANDLLDLTDAFYDENQREPISDNELLDFARDLRKEDGTPTWTPERLKLATIKLRQSHPASSLDEPLSSGEESEDEGGDEPTRGDFLSTSPEKSACDEESEKIRAEKIEEAIEEADLDEETAALLKSFLRNPAGIYDDSEIAALLGHPTEAELSRLLRDGLKNGRLRKALKEKGLIEAG